MLHRESAIQSLKRLSDLRTLRVARTYVEVTPPLASSKSLVILAQVTKESEQDERAMLLKLVEALKKQSIDAILYVNTDGRFAVGPQYKNSSFLLLGVSSDSAPNWFGGRIISGPTAKELMLSPQKKKDLWSQIISD